MVALKKPSTETAVTVDTTPAPSLSFRSTTLDLKRATALLARVADRRSSMPMLANVCMRVTESAVVLSATDLNVSATVRLDLTNTARSPGGWVVNAKALAELVKGLPPADVSITRHGPIGLSVTSGNVASILHGTTDRDFPKVPDSENLAWHAVPAESLADMLRGVAFSVCKDETRFHLNGTLYECPDGEHARMVSTDGHRLTRSDCTMPGAPTKGVIIPTKGANEIRKLLDEGKRKGTCEMAIKTPHMFVRYGAVTLSVKLIDAQFPPYDQVIPKDPKILATFERKPLIAALKRAAMACSETRGVKLTLASGKLTLTSDHPDTGTATETLMAESLHENRYDIGCNPKYLIELLGEIDCDHVTFGFGKELDPMIVRSTDHAVEHSVADAPYLGVVMPMRI